MRKSVMLLLVGVLCAGSAWADVRTEEKSQVKFEGMLGRMMNMFGGRGAREGIVSTVAVKGDRKATLNETTGQIVDLREEKVYDIDIRNKTYTVTTFAEIRRQMEEARKKAAEQASRDTKDAPPAEPGREVEVDFDLKESGQRRAINGFDAREVVMTIAVREKGKSLEDGGGLVLTTNTWLAPKVPNMSQIAEFDRKYAGKLATPMMLDAQQTATMLAMYPMLRDAMARLEKENVNLDGTPVMTVTKVESVAPPSAAGSNQPKEEARPAGIGGIGGRLGRRVLNRGNQEEKPAAGNRATFMTMQHELLKVSATVADAETAVPAGFKLKGK